MPNELVACPRCASTNRKRFPAEIVLKFPELAQINKPPVYLPHPMLVCMDCGFAELMIPGPDLEQLK
jgi:hypothetical protein